MSLKVKLDNANLLISCALKDFKKPAILCSFGKDSVLLAYLVLSINKDIPVIFFRHNYNPTYKYRYADKIIHFFGDKFGAEVIQGLPPAGVDLVCHNGDLDFIESRIIGNKTIALPVGIIPDQDGICGRDKILNQIQGSYSWDYDLLFVGHKACDEDSFAENGKIPIDVDYLKIDGCSTLSYPIRDFTHQEVFSSFQELNIPMDTDRYEYMDGSWSEKSDKTINGDWTNACMNCLNPLGKKTVYCPKHRAYINNIGKDIVKPNPFLNLEYLKG